LGADADRLRSRFLRSALLRSSARQLAHSSPNPGVPAAEGAAAAAAGVGLVAATF